MNISFSFTGVLVFLLVWVRFAGMIIFNPLFGRANVPAMARNGITLLLTIIIAPLQATEAVLAMAGIQFAFAIVRELFIGFVFGFVFQIFYLLLFFAGDMMDNDFGIAMAKNFDPATSIQVSFSGYILTIMFSVYFFASDSHHALIRLYAETFKMIPLGADRLGLDVPTFIITLFVQVFALVLRLVAPFMVAEFILQVCMGLLMKLIPQITVFVINFQLRIFLGVLMLVVFAPFIGKFMNGFIETLLDSLSAAAIVLSGK